VVGLVLDVLRSLGAEIDEHFEERAAAPAEDMGDDEEQEFAGDASAVGVPAGDVATGEQGPAGFSRQTTAKGQA
jgi:multicomponent Na+:H+ antiporter subunit A